jgi:hypothetical protein
MSKVLKLTEILTVKYSMSIEIIILFAMYYLTHCTVNYYNLIRESVNLASYIFIVRNFLPIRTIQFES